MKNIVLFASCTLLAVAGIFAAIRLERRAFERKIDDSKKEISTAVAQEIVKETLGMAARELGLPPPGDPPRTNPATNATTRSGPLSMLPVLGGLVKDGAVTIKEVVDQVWGISPEQQVRIGAMQHEKRMQDLPLSSDEALLVRLNALMKPFTAHSRRSFIQYRLTVVEDDEFSAYSCLGGYVYVHTGLVSKCQSDAEIAFILGHEVAHEEFGHMASFFSQRMLALQMGESVGGDLGFSLAEFAEETYRDLVAISYSQDQEFACDEWSYRHMRKMGYSREEALAGVRRLQAVSEEEGDVRRESSSDVAVVVGETLNRHFRSHPFTEDRVARLEALP